MRSETGGGNTHKVCGKGKRVFGICRSTIPSSSVNGPSRQWSIISQGMCLPRSPNPSQMPIIAAGVRITPLFCRRNGLMGWMKTFVFGCTPGLITMTDNANPILKHKETPRPCLRRAWSCRKAQEASWRSRSRRWYASPQVHLFFDSVSVARVG